MAKRDFIMNTQIGGTNLPKTSLADYAANKIRIMIQENKLMPGEHINIDLLSRDLGISQTPIREALQKLIAEGIAVYRPKVGYSVRNLTLHEYLQVSEIHQVLETYLVKEIAKMPFIVDIASLYSINEELKRRIGENDREGIAQANDRFHRKLYENYHNKLMITRLFDLWNEVRSLRNIMYNNKIFTNKIAMEHEAIIEAIEKGDPAAAERAMTAHYISGRESAIISFPVDTQD
jgi:DNA-binding GntR family transcriptional regulator